MASCNLFLPKSLSLSWTMPTLSFTTVQSHFFFFLLIFLEYTKLFSTSGPLHVHSQKYLGSIKRWCSSSASMSLLKVVSKTPFLTISSEVGNPPAWSASFLISLVYVGILYNYLCICLLLIVSFSWHLQARILSKLIIIVFHGTWHVESLINNITRKKGQKRKKNDST